MIPPEFPALTGRLSTRTVGFRAPSRRFSLNSRAQIHRFDWMRPYRFRLFYVAMATILLAYMANTTAPGIPTVHSTRVPYQPPVCKHGTMPDLDPHSLDYGMPVCIRGK